MNSCVLAFAMRQNGAPVVAVFARGQQDRSVDFRGHGMHAQKSVAGESLVQVPGACQYMTQGQDCVRESWMGALSGGALRATMQ